MNEKEDKQMLGNFAYCNPTKLFFIILLKIDILRRVVHNNY